ncbi:hypothetical protein [Maritimibacter alkaliphilus]|uniref:hypothetical protein n=1 Tax=Maritimibacter alkaliphilus TaxID=404236 RepID=UPI001C973D91|nr:hypothetical protein [Maritimibacter alkaliphilus]MBY6089770.1 hypothetical protein [Maritimibacter alkaliphilus]
MFCGLLDDELAEIETLEICQIGDLGLAERHRRGVAIFPDDTRPGLAVPSRDGPVESAFAFLVSLRLSDPTFCRLAARERSAATEGDLGARLLADCRSEAPWPSFF